MEQTYINKRKICVVITARPSYSRVKSVISAIKHHKKLELQLVVMASALIDRYGSAVNVIENDGFEITAKLYTILEGENLTSAAKTTALGILELSTLFEKIKPDIVITVADRYETIATAIAASYMNIPLGHIQGGEVTGNIDEKVRHSITKLADYHFVASQDAADRVSRLGECCDYIFNFGCPSIDLARDIGVLDFNPFEKYGGVGNILNLSNGYLVVMQHPVTNEHEQSRIQIESTIEAIKRLNLPTLWFWPNVDAGADGTSKALRVSRENGLLNNVHFFKNMTPIDFLKLLKSSICLIGNSSVGIRECAFIGHPVVNIGTRQSGRMRSENVVDVGYNSSEIVDAVMKIKNSPKPAQSFIYGDGNSGYKIADKLSNVDLRFHKKITY